MARTSHKHVLTILQKSPMASWSVCLATWYMCQFFNDSENIGSCIMNRMRLYFLKPFGALSTRDLLRVWDSNMFDEIIDTSDHLRGGYMFGSLKGASSLVIDLTGYFDNIIFSFIQVRFPIVSLTD